MEHSPLLALLSLLLPQVLLLTFADDLECDPGFRQKIFYIEQPSEFTKDQLILNVQFDDCAGNDNLNFEVSNQDFRVEADGSLVAEKNVTAVGRAIFVHAHTAHAEDMAEVKFIGGKERHSSLKHLWRLPKNAGLLRKKRSILVPPVSIPENQRPPFPKIQPGRVTANGKPEGAKFRLSGRGADQEPRGVFKINELTGEIMVTRALDREEYANYVLQVEVTDVSGKAIDGPTDLEISVIDQNDNKPIFREGSYTGHVLEGSPTGTIVMRMTAVDADDPTTENALLRYNILKQTPDKPSPNMFYIDPEKGDIVTVVSPALLDRETLSTPKYELIIEAKDMSGSDVGLTGTATATIVIDDKNDHAPEFTKKEFQGTVNEGATGVIVNLTVDDKDDPATAAWRAVYTIINGNPGQSFEIHTNTQNNEGMLSVVKPLDYEIAAFHTLLIKVENEDPLIPDISYGPSSTTTVQITVHDVNEGPVFQPDPMTVTKQENIPIGSEVFTVRATDPDVLQHQSIRYSIYKDPAGWLSIDPTSGTVHTAGVLDRESPFVHNNTYAAQFLAIDNGTPPATGTGTLHITLEDVNDNAPIIFPTLAKVCEDTKDFNVVILGASDKDLRPNVDPFKFELSKQSPPDKAWKITMINNTHAQVTVPQNLKRANYNIPVFVTDSGNPPLTNSTELKVQVCSCKKSKMDCSSAAAPHASVALLILFALFNVLCL